MTEPTTPGASAGEMIVDIIRECSPDELRVLGSICRDHTARSMAMETAHLAALWHVIGLAADLVLEDHPDAITAADLELLNDARDTPPPGSDGV